MFWGCLLVSEGAKWCLGVPMVSVGAYGCLRMPTGVCGCLLVSTECLLVPDWCLL